MRDQLLGAWRLVSQQRRSTTGKIEMPFGENPQGLLVYSYDGHMAAVLNASERSSFKSNDVRGATVEEKVAAYDTCIAYAGTYTIEGDRITHHVQVSLLPNWIGGDQQRTVRLEGDRMILATQPILAGGEEWVYELNWTRATPA